MWGEEYSWILFPQVVTDLHFCQLLFESMTYVEYFVTDGIPDYKRHTDGTPERPPASYKLGKQTKLSLTFFVSIDCINFEIIEYLVLFNL